jgi:hypothetical protein
MQVKVILPKPHAAQEKLVYWNFENTTAQCLVAPCGTKFGKSFACALWLTREALTNSNYYCVWIAPTYYKAQIGLRYIRSMLPSLKGIRVIESRSEILLPNGTIIKFLHGHDAETTVEGEAIDRFVIDESGKQTEQLWFSLYTTLSQTGGKGIITGTPRGFNWYYKVYTKAVNGDSFFCHDTFKTEQSPYISKKAVDTARRLLPPMLFKQYYEAKFVSMSTVFGDTEQMFNDIPVNPLAKFWIHPDINKRKIDTVTGWDIAKVKDYSVFYTVNLLGELVGYARFHRINYTDQVQKMKTYLDKNFFGDKILRYDMTGVGNAVSEMISDADIDAQVTGVVMSNPAKQEMITRLTSSIENGWHKAPRIERIAHEFGSYEVKTTKSGLFTYSAPDGEHDDVVSAAMLAVSGAYALREDEEELEKQGVYNISENRKDAISEAASVFTSEYDEEDFFDDDFD